MQQFTVPQFIDVEDKMIGPITARQFIIMLSGFMVIALFYKILDFSAFLFFGLIVFAISGIFAFFKVNGMPFHFFILNFVQTYGEPFLRVWNNDYARDKNFNEIEDAIAEVLPNVPVKKFGTSHLTKLALIVDTQGSYKGQDLDKVKDINK